MFVFSNSYGYHILQTSFKAGFDSWQMGLEKFYFEGELAEASLPSITEGNNANKGLVISFTTDNKYKSEQKGGMEINNTTGTYSLASNSKLIIMGDTVQILELNKTHLKLYRDSETPIILFKRL